MNRYLPLGSHQFKDESFQHRTVGRGALAFFPLAVVLFPTGVGERSSGQSHVTPVFTTQAETLATALSLWFF